MMNQLPVPLLHQVLSYIIPYHIELRHDIKDRRIIRDFQSNTVHTKNQSLLPRVILQDNQLYMIKDTSRFYCSDVIVANSTWVFADGYWRECYPDDETMKTLLSCPDQYLQLQYQKNPHPVIVQYLLQHPEKIVWHLFCINPNEDAVAYCIQHADCINWVSFCKNTSKKAIDYMVQHKEHIDWFVFSQNPSIYTLKIDEKELKEWTLLLHN
jgi:hypothetical protein